jgi:hypothetical protein
MGEADPVAVQLDQLGVLTKAQAQKSVPRDRCGDEPDLWLRHRRSKEQRFLGVFGEGSEASTKELAKLAAHGQRFTGRQLIAALLQRTREFEREEGVSARRLVQPLERRPWEDELEAAMDEMVKSAEAEGADLDYACPLLRQEPAYLGQALTVRLRPYREEKTDRVLTQPSHGKSQGKCRGGVEPLEVVYRDKRRPFEGSGSKHTQERERDGRLMRHGTAGITKEQCHLECVPLRRGKLRERLLDYRLQQIGETRVRHLAFDLSWSCREDAVAAVTSGEDSRAPQRGLPDAGLAFDDECRREPINCMEEVAHRGELRVAPDDLDLARPQSHDWRQMMLRNTRPA